MRKLSPLLVGLAVLASGCGDHRPPRFETTLQPVNGSKTKGSAQLSLAGDGLSVRIHATGLEPKRIHNMHLFGASAGPSPRCPTAGSDLDGDGLVEAREARRDYGKPVLALQPYPTVGAGGDLDYRVTLTVDPKQVKPLEGRFVILEGRSAPVGDRGAEQYVENLPVACGRLRLTEGKAGSD